LALLLAGCVQPDAASPPPAVPGSSLLPPSLLVDRSPRDTLQVVVHAKQGLVRYAFVNLTINGTLMTSRQATYAVEEVLNTSLGAVQVDVVDGSVAYHWQAFLALNLTAQPPTLAVRASEASDQAPLREQALPFEKLLARAPTMEATRG